MRACIEQDEAGSTTTEHVLVIALVALGALGAWRALGEHVSDRTACAASAIRGGSAVDCDRAAASDDAGVSGHHEALARDVTLPRALRASASERAPQVPEPSECGFMHLRCAYEGAKRAAGSAWERSDGARDALAWSASLAQRIESLAMPPMDPRAWDDAAALRLGVARGVLDWTTGTAIGMAALGKWLVEPEIDRWWSLAHGDLDGFVHPRGGEIDLREIWRGVAGIPASLWHELDTFAVGPPSEAGHAAGMLLMDVASTVVPGGALTKVGRASARAMRFGRAARAPERFLSRLRDTPDPRVAVYQESLRRAESLEALATRRYGEEIGLASLTRLQTELGPAYGALVADPGVVMRLDDFLSFAATQDVRAMAPWELRSRYARHLGVARVQRGLALTPEQALAVRREGMVAGFFRPDHAGRVGWSEADPLSHNFFSMMKERIHGGGWGPISAAPDMPPIDALMSVTFDRRIAQLVPGEMVQAIGRSDVKVYIYTIEIPEIDLLPGPVLDRMRYVNRHELFAPFVIRPSEITRVEGPLEPQMIDFSEPG